MSKKIKMEIPVVDEDPKPAENAIASSSTEMKTEDINPGRQNEKNDEPKYAGPPQATYLNRTAKNRAARQRRKIRKKEKKEQENKASDEDETMRCYPMNNISRGHCLIFSNTKFDFCPDQTYRENDAEKLKKAFESFDFVVTIFKDLNMENLKMELKRAAELNHSDNDMFICCFLTHGGEGFIYTANGEMLTITGIVWQFNELNCPSLISKPKLFFFDSSQGQQYQSSVGTSSKGDIDISFDSPQDNLKEGEYVYRAYISIPSNDVMIGLSTLNGCVSLGHNEKGSFYVNALVNVLDQVDKKIAIGHFTIMVANELNKLIADCDMPFPVEGYLQTANWMSKMMKHLYLHKKK